LMAQQVVDFSPRSVMVVEDADFGVEVYPGYQYYTSVACLDDGKPPGVAVCALSRSGRRRLACFPHSERRVVWRGRGGRRIADSGGKSLDNEGRRSNIKRIAPFHRLFLWGLVVPERGASGRTMFLPRSLPCRRNLAAAVLRWNTSAMSPWLTLWTA